MKLIVASEADSTSRLVAEILIENYGFKLAGGKLYRMGEIFLKLISERHIYADGLAEDLAPELLVVASSHRSEAGKRALLTHPVGIVYKFFLPGCSLITKSNNIKLKTGR